MLTLIITGYFNHCLGFFQGNSLLYICLTCKTVSGQNVPCGTCSAMPQPCVYRSVHDKTNKLLGAVAATNTAHLQTPTDVLLPGIPQQVAVTASQPKALNRIIVMPAGATRQVTVLACYCFLYCYFRTMTILLYVAG